MNRNGVFTVSLDVELNWGVRDVLQLMHYEANLRGERAATHALLDLFTECKIHATWAIVGFLFFERKSDLVARLPSEQPNYTNRAFSPYDSLTDIGEDEDDDPLHLGASLVRMIGARKHQEIATHTFSHFYCLERGQDAAVFRADLEAAVAAAQLYGTKIYSIVFPRNQVNPDYLEICRELGIGAYRGTEKHWLYAPRSFEEESALRRGARLVDAYLNFTGHHTVSFGSVARKSPLNVSQSRFLRPYSRKLAILEPLRLRRILTGLEKAAQRGEIYHLWWHPHNFGVDLQTNLSFLRRILDHFSLLRTKYGMESLNMREVAHRVEAEAIAA